MDPTSHNMDGWMRRMERNVNGLIRSAGSGKGSEASVAVTTGLGLTGTITAHKYGRAVTLDGVISGAEPTLPASVLLLPEGFRPSTAMKVWVGGSSTTNISERLLSIDTAGVVRVLTWSNGGSGMWFNGVHFIAAA